MATRFDAIIVGAGQAGPPLAARLSKAGMKIAVVERKLFGGTCVNTGCIPTKSWVASAHAAHLARRGADFGFSTGGPVTVDMKAVKQRKDGIIAPSRDGVEKGLRSLENCTVFHESARFLAPHQLQVGSATIEADTIFLNVGGRATVPELPGIHDVPFLINSTILQLKELPKHLVIVGGSYIGCEFAQMFRRFGAEVTVVERAAHLLSKEDEDVSACVEEILKNSGVTLRLESECIHFKPHREGVLVGTNCTTGEPDVLGSHVLLAVGRKPNLDDLGLDAAGLALDDRGYLKVDDQLRTSVAGIWAMGDCNGRGAFTHTSYNDFEIVAANLLDGEPRRVSDRIPAYNVYIDPPLARIGMSEREVRSSGIPALIGRRPMTKVGRAVEKGETEGFMKVLVDRASKKILGASLLGTGCDEVIHCLLDIMYAGAPYTTLTHAMHIHPTVSELVPTLLESLEPLA